MVYKFLLLLNVFDLSEIQDITQMQGRQEHEVGKFLERMLER
jgi:hypothetical protein